ncbi:MAG: hypothetical protein WAZ36_01095 [Sediminibacterium sp.]
MPSHVVDMNDILKLLGATTLHSQRFEYALACLMLIVNKNVDPFHNNGKLKILDYLESLKKETLGSLFKILNKLAKVDKEAQTDFKLAPDARKSNNNSSLSFPTRLYSSVSVFQVFLGISIFNKTAENQSFDSLFGLWDVVTQSLSIIGWLYPQFFSSTGSRHFS